MLPVSFGAGRSGSLPTPPLRESSPDEPQDREKSPRADIRAPMRRLSPCFTAPEYRRLFPAQPPREPAPVIVISDDDTESRDTSESAPSSDSSSGLYRTSTSSSDTRPSRSFDRTDASSGSSSVVTYGSDPLSPWPSPSVSSGSVTSKDNLVDRYFAGTFPPRSPFLVENLSSC
ncbi:hypothetical protein PIB30_056715 [Stylosanthes scabra]|uniref:Uncharacterized protein n=1 Tax=Stylosanthes scabra TaxID=79078 RepID=A0ABU6VLX2_9FABA|nr:hypothetical protein [Stylosanthes scabra]